MKRAMWCFVGLWVVACSGSSTDAGLFGGGDDGGADAPLESGGSLPVQTNDGGRGRVDATTPSEDAGVPLPDAAPPRDAGSRDAGEDADPGIRCFGEPSKYCPLTQICCVTDSAPGLCGAANACTDNGGVPFPCADGRNCGGKACCGAWDDTTSSYTIVACSVECANDGSEHQLCDPAAKPDECTPLGLTCKKPLGGAGYAYCQ